MNRSLVRVGELLSYALGVFMTLFFVAQLALGEVQRRHDIAQFEESTVQWQQVASIEPAGSQNDNGPGVNPLDATHSPAFSTAQAGPPNTLLWSPERIAHYEASMEVALPTVLGLLEVPSVGLRVPIYPSDSDLNMDRGAGIIDGMSYPHEAGNIGIAGHRDGYFRVLKDIEVGDKILLETLQGQKQFTIDSIKVVETDDRSVLQDTQGQTVTLITCYPFYFVGHAPQRFVVTASIDITDVNQQRRN